MGPWDQILLLLKQRPHIRPDQFNIWFRTIQFKRLTDEQIELEAPSEYYRNWISTHFTKDIEQAVQEVLNSPREVVLLVKKAPNQPLLPLDEPAAAEGSAPPDQSAETSKRKKANTISGINTTNTFGTSGVSTSVIGTSGNTTSALPREPHPPTNQANPPPSPPITPASLAPTFAQALPRTPPLEVHTHQDIQAIQDAQASPRVSPPPHQSPPEDPPVDDADKQAGLNPRYTFEAFVVGPSNQLAHAAALAVAAHPAGEFNPLFFYGGVGLGKTHLMQAVGHAAIARDPRLRVIYRTSEQFMNELISSIERKQMHIFREYYRTECNILLIDDIQLIAGKERTQEEFFHTFNALYNAGKQIILTSDKTPQEIPALEERLQSRFSWGLIADIQRPDVETRIAILRKKAAREAMLVPPEVVSYLAHRIDTNVRELEGCLKRVNAHALLSGQPLTLEFAQKMLSPLLQAAESHLTPDFILQHVSQFFGVSLDEIRGHSRGRAIAYPRQIAMYLARVHTSLSYPEIGRLFGKDHTTIINAFQRIEKARSADPSTRSDLENIERMMHVQS